MAALIDALAKTVSLLMEVAISGAEVTFEKIKPSARVYLKSLIITTLIFLVAIPVLVILKAATGWPVFMYLAAILAIALTGVLVLLYTPLALLLGMLAGKTINPMEAGQRYLKFVGMVIFGVFMASLFLMRMPLERNMAALPVLAVAAAAAVLGSALWGGWFSGKFYVTVAMITFGLTTLSLILPKPFKALDQKLQGLDTYLGEVMGYREPPKKITKKVAPQTVRNQAAAIYDSLTRAFRLKLKLSDKDLAGLAAKLEKLEEEERKERTSRNLRNTRLLLEEMKNRDQKSTRR